MGRINKYLLHMYLLKKKNHAPYVLTKTKQKQKKSRTLCTYCIRICEEDDVDLRARTH